MSTSTLTYVDGRVGVLAKLGDYLELTKPRIAALELVTVTVAAFVASAGIPTQPLLLLHALLGTTLVAASASALNQWLESAADLRMPRTADRPLPAGRLSRRSVFVFGMLTGAIGVLYLALAVNMLTAGLGLASWVLYVVIYTPMKYRTSANTMVGAVAGGIPVLMGWTAITDSLFEAQFLLPATLFLVVFLWQFPHFMAIAWLYRDDYAAADIKMLTVVEPTGRRAGAQAVIAALSLIPVSLLPSVMEGTLYTGSIFYFAGSLVLGISQLAVAIRFMLRRDEKSARWLLYASLIYLPMFLGLLLIKTLVFPG